MIRSLALYSPLDPSVVGGIRSWVRGFLKPYSDSRHISLRLVHTETRPDRSACASPAAERDIDVRCLPGLAMPLYGGRVPRPMRLKRELQDVDLVYFDNGYALQDIAVLAATRDIGVPVVSGFHSVILSGNVLHDATWELIGRNTLRYFDAGHALNTEDATYLRGLGMRNVMTIPLSVDGTTFFPGQLRKHFTVTFVGRLHPQKGIDTLVKLIALLHQRLPDNVEFAIAGDGPLRDKLVPLENLPRVTLLGNLNREQAATLLGESAVVLMPSRYETFGYVAAEAISAGALVVASDVSGLRDVVDGHGILIPPRQPLQLWIDAVSAAYSEWALEPLAFNLKRTERRTYASAGFSFDAVASLFDRLIERASRS